MKKSLILIAFFLLICSFPLMAWRSNLYPTNWYPGYVNPVSEGYLHDFSYAGYHSGMIDIPNPTNNTINITQAPYNADNTGNNDVTSIIQQAVDYLSTVNGGVIYFPAGTYKVSVPSGTEGVRIKSNNIVLRGAGSGLTFIKNTTTDMRFKTLFKFWPENSPWIKNFTSSTGTKIALDLSMPTTFIPVESVSGFNIGDLVLIGNECTPEFIEEHKSTGYWTQSLVRGPRFCRYIKSIDAVNKIIEIDAPTRYFLKTRDNSRLWKPNAQLSECGIEKMAIGNLQNNKTGWEEGDYNVPGTGAYDVHYSYLVEFKNCVNCWMKYVSSYKPAENTLDVRLLSNFLNIEDSRCVTVKSCDIRKTQYQGGGGNGYLYSLMGNDCLLDGCYADGGRHNYIFRLMSCNGNVIYNCTSKNSKYASEFHMYLSMANLFDSFQMSGDYIAGIFRPSGVAGNYQGYSTSQSVIWNTKCTQLHSVGYLIDSRQFGAGYVIGTSGVSNNVVTTPVSGIIYNLRFDTSPIDMVEGLGTGLTLEPQSLYQDQLAKRKTLYQSRAYITESLIPNMGKVETFNLNMLQNANIESISIYAINGAQLFKSNKENISTAYNYINNCKTGVYIIRVNEPLKFSTYKLIAKGK